MKILKEKEPVSIFTLSRYLKKDKTSIENALQELIDVKSVGRHEFFSKFKKGESVKYFLLPLNSKVHLILLLNQHKSSLGTEFYYGIRKGIPLIVQLQHKFNCCAVRRSTLRRIMERRTKENVDDVNLHGSKEKFDRVNWQARIQLNSIGEYLRNYKFDSNIDSIASEMNLAFIYSIDYLYKILDSYTNWDRRKEKFRTELEKITILQESLKFNSRAVAKRRGISSKTVSKIIKDFSKDDRTFNVQKINEVYEKKYGVVGVDIGERLEGVRRTNSTSED